MKIVFTGLFLATITSISASAQINKPGPQALVYKTKGNYNNLVPVTLSADKTEITSYPAPTDIKANGDFTKPTKLAKHYLLDNRGINEHVAFLNISYKEYANLKEIPQLDSLFKMIIDKDPLTELCDCGYKNDPKYTPKQLKKLIKKRKLRTTCKVIK